MTKKKSKKLFIVIPILAIIALLLCACERDTATIRVTHYNGGREYLQSQRDYQVNRGYYIEEGGFTIKTIDDLYIDFESDEAMYDDTKNSTAKMKDHRTVKDNPVTVTDATEDRAEIYDIEYLQ